MCLCGERGLRGGGHTQLEDVHMSSTRAAWTSGGNASGEPVRSSGRLYVISAGAMSALCTCVFVAMAMKRDKLK